MKKLIFNKYIIYFFRFIIGCTFIYASIDKINDPKTFSDLIDNFHISPLFISNIIALILPWLELLCGISLITGFLLPSSIIIIMMSLCWFIFILSQAIFRGIDTQCGCFKVEDITTNTNFKIELIKRVVEDVILLLMSFVVYQNISNLKDE